MLALNGGNLANLNLLHFPPSFRVSLVFSDPFPFYHHRSPLSYLKSSHISWVAGILETVLVTLEEEFEEKPVIIRQNRTTKIVKSSRTKEKRNRGKPLYEYAHYEVFSWRKTWLFCWFMLDYVTMHLVRKTMQTRTD